MHGVVSRRELLAAGVGRRAIEHRLRTQRLFTKYEGVYAVGRPDLSVLGERRAIVLACGEGAALSHRSAAGAWSIRPDGAATWDVTIPRGARRRPKAPVTIHRASLRTEDITLLAGIPTTSLARTMLDLAATVPAHHLRRAVERSEQLELFHLPDVERVLAAYPLHRGCRALRALLEDFRLHGMTMTRSDTEAAMLQLCLDHGIERPVINRHAGGREVDFRWPHHNLIVEVDGYGSHNTRRAFRRDRAQDREALRRGVRTARFTAWEVEHRTAQTAAEILALIAAR